MGISKKRKEIDVIMKRKQWRLLSLLLIFAMILSMMPAMAFANGEGGTEKVTALEENAITTIPYSEYSSLSGSAYVDTGKGCISNVTSGIDDSVSFKINVPKEESYAVVCKYSTVGGNSGYVNISVDNGSQTFSRVANASSTPRYNPTCKIGVLSAGEHTFTLSIQSKNSASYNLYELVFIPANLTTDKVVSVKGNQATEIKYSEYSKTINVFKNDAENCIDIANPSEIVEFTLDVEEEKEYLCSFTYATPYNNATINFSVDGGDSTSVILSDAASFNKYSYTDWIELGTLTKGKHTVSVSGAVRSYNLRSVRISTKFDENDGYENDALYISLSDDHTLAWLNQSKSNESKGTYELVPAGESYDPDSALPLKKIKGRGNSSWNSATKKGYNITLEEKKELISGAGSAKKWCLLGCGVTSQDTTFLSSIAAFELYKQLHGSSAISWRMVDLYVNDKYVGLYMLTEKVEINEERININSAEFTTEGTTSRIVNNRTGDITQEEQAILDTGITEFKYSPDAEVKTDGGYVIEAGYYYNTAACGFKTNRGVSFELKEPEYVSLEQMAKITAFVKEYEDALCSSTGYNSKGKHYSDYLDLDSAAKLFLVDSFSGNMDMYVSSTYLCIDGDADGLKGKLTSGPAWDYNYYQLNSNLYGRDAGGNGAFRWIPQLLKKGDFVAKLNEVNNAEFKNLITKMNGSEDTEKTLRWWEKKFHDAQLRNELYWGFGYEDRKSTYLDGFSGRVNTWDTIWSDSVNALRGVTVTNEDGTLTANALGATTYQWYKVNADNVTTGTAVPGANGDTFAPTTDGIYYVQVNGKALAGTTASTMISAPYSYVMHTHIYDKVDGQAATCTVDGWKDYYKCNGCDKYFTEATGDNEILDLEAWKLDEGKLGKTGHSYGTPKYTWNADHTSCTAEKTCTAFGCGNKVTEDGTVTSTVKTPATCTTKGTTTYTATFGSENGFETQTEDVQDIALAAHNYSNGVCTVCGAKKPSSGGGGIYIPPAQKPIIDNNVNAKTELSSDGTKLTIKAEKGYKVVDVIVNGVSKGAVDTFTGLKTGDKVVVVTEEIETEPTIEEVKAELGTSSLVARSQAVTLKNGKKAIKITWYDQNGNEVKFDGVEIYRSTKRNTGYGKKPIYVSKSGVYYNTSIKPGTKYYYRVRGFREIDGQKYYTNWSLKAFRAW